MKLHSRTVAFFWTIGGALALVALFSSCVARTKTEASLPAKEAVSAQTEVKYLTPPNFSEDQLNVYLDGDRANFVGDRMDVFRKVLRISREPEFEGSTNGRKFYSQQFGGGRIHYLSDTGEVSSIEIVGNSVSLENGGRVGDARSSILERYPGGFSFPGDGKTYRYYVVREAADGQIGLGFTFIFNDSDLVAKIRLEYFSFYR